jgi:hypothetical protein
LGRSRDWLRQETRWGDDDNDSKYFLRYTSFKTVSLIPVKKNLRPVFFNFVRRGKLKLSGAKLASRGKLCPLGVKLSHRGEKILLPLCFSKNRECSPHMVLNKGDP